MATKRQNFAKRQREMATKRKAEEKRARRQKKKAPVQDTVESDGDAAMRT